MALAIGCFAVVIPVVMLVTTPVELGSPFPSQNQDAETALYVVAFMLILPLTLIAVPRLTTAIAAGPNAGALSLLAASLVATLAGAILLARVLPGGGGVVEVLVIVGAWSAFAAVALARAASARPWGGLLRVAGLAHFVWPLAGTLTLASLLAFTSTSSISLVTIAVGAVALPLAIAAYARHGGDGAARLPRPWGVAADLTVIAVILLAVPDLVIVRPEDAATNGSAGFDADVIQFHQNFLLGPANEVLAGGAMLVDTASQYGVAPIYLLAGWFQLAPIGYGTLGFLDGVLFALLFASAYCLLRLSATPRWLATAAIALAVIALAYNLDYSIGSLPQHGPLRFGLPMALILAAVIGERWPRRAGATDVVQLAVVGLASIWSLEAFAFTVAAFVGLACFAAWTRPGQGRLRWLARRGALGLAACVAAHAVLAAATLAFAGELPDWGRYLDFLDAFLFRGLGELTYDFSPWSAGLAVGAVYFASAAALVLLGRQRRDIVEREPVAMTALCGTTVYGIVLFGYFVDRSLDHILPYVSLPALLVGTLWLSLLLRGALGASRPLRLGGLTLALAVSLLLLAVAWSSIGERFPRTALAHAAPRGNSLRLALRRLWHPPPFDQRAPQGELLLDRYMPGQDRVPILVESDLGVEILLRSGRANALPFSDPVEDSFAGAPDLPALRRAVRRLEPGDRLLIQKSGLAQLRLLEQPRRDVAAEPVRISEALTAQQVLALGLIGRRFALRVVHRDEQGFVVAALLPRR